MVKITKEVVVEVDVEVGAGDVGICDLYKTNADIIFAIIELDTSIADWHFTIDLMRAVVGMLLNDDMLLNEFVYENIDDTHYQELYKEVRTLYKAMKKAYQDG